MDNPPEKLALKIMVRRHVNEHWKKEIIQGAETKSTLKFLNKALGEIRVISDMRVNSDTITFHQINK